MNKYKGFKVGDKVEISWSFPITGTITGTITEIYPKRIGGMCEPDIVIIKVIDCEFDLVRLIAESKIKKLPKYAVGDVVYLKNIPFTPHGVAFTHKYVVNKFDGKYLVTSQDNQRSIWATESDLRLWKETKLTHCLQSDGVTWSDGGTNGWKKEWYRKIEYLESYGTFHLFVVTTNWGYKALFKGIKGDDI